MRTLDEVLAEIIGVYQTDGLSLEDAVAKVGPFVDLDAESAERVAYAGVLDFAGKDASYLRAHPIADDETELAERAYRGRFQFRPPVNATASAVYQRLSSIRLDVGGANKTLIEFDAEDVSFVAARFKAQAEGFARRQEFFDWLAGELDSRGVHGVKGLPKRVLAEAELRAGRTFT